MPQKLSNFVQKVKQSLCTAFFAHKILIKEKKFELSYLSTGYLIIISFIYNYLLTTESSSYQHVIASLAH